MRDTSFSFYPNAGNNCGRITRIIRKLRNSLAVPFLHALSTIPCIFPTDWYIFCIFSKVPIQRIGSHKPTALYVYRRMCGSARKLTTKNFLP